MGSASAPEATGSLALAGVSLRAGAGGHHRPGRGAVGWAWLGRPRPLGSARGGEGEEEDGARGGRCWRRAALWQDRAVAPPAVIAPAAGVPAPGSPAVRCRHGETVGITGVGGNFHLTVEFDCRFLSLQKMDTHSCFHQTHPAFLKTESEPHHRGTESTCALFHRYPKLDAHQSPPSAVLPSTPQLGTFLFSLFSSVFSLQANQAQSTTPHTHLSSNINVRYHLSHVSADHRHQTSSQSFRPRPSSPQDPSRV